MQPFRLEMRRLSAGSLLVGVVVVKILAAF